MIDQGALPELSVLICTYNGAKYIQETIESVLHDVPNTAPLLCYIDGSSDGTLEALKSYEARIEVIHCSENRGIPHSRNSVIKQCKTKLAAFIDHDDLWASGRYKEMLTVLRNPEVKLVFGSVANFEIDASGQMITAEPQVARMPSGFAFSKSVFDQVGYFDTSLHGAYLLDWMMRCQKERIQIIESKAMFALRRLHETNVSKVRRAEFDREYLRVLHRHRGSC
jgi:glycosyltransferase involved in cell wall biosynthesis